MQIYQVIIEDICSSSNIETRARKESKLALGRRASWSWVTLVVLEWSDMYLVLIKGYSITWQWQKNDIEFIELDQVTNAGRPNRPFLIRYQLGKWV